MKDVNNTYYHLVLGQSDWNLDEDENSSLELEYDEQREGLQLAPQVYQPKSEGNGALEPEDWRDSDRDQYGHWYWIDQDRQQVYVRWAKAKQAEVLLPLPEKDCNQPSNSIFHPVEESSAHDDLKELSGLAVTTEGYLVRV